MSKIHKYRPYVQVTLHSHQGISYTPSAVLNLYSGINVIIDIFSNREYIVSLYDNFTTVTEYDKK